MMRLVGNAILLLILFIIVCYETRMKYTCLLIGLLCIESWINLLYHRAFSKLKEEIVDSYKINERIRKAVDTHVLGSHMK